MAHTSDFAPLVSMETFKHEPALWSGNKPSIGRTPRNRLGQGLGSRTGGGTLEILSAGTFRWWNPILPPPFYQDGIINHAGAHAFNVQVQRGAQFNELFNQLLVVLAC
jgi:hypothetical protein